MYALCLTGALELTPLSKLQMPGAVGMPVVIWSAQTLRYCEIFAGQVPLVRGNWQKISPIYGLYSGTNGLCWPSVLVNPDALQAKSGGFKDLRCRVLLTRLLTS